MLGCCEIQVGNGCGVVVSGGGDVSGSKERKAVCV